MTLPVIPATSPTLADAMRQCALGAGLARAHGSGAFVLGNPKAWLGTVYHEVLEKIAQVDLHTESIEAAADSARRSSQTPVAGPPVDRTRPISARPAPAWKLALAGSSGPAALRPGRAQRGKGRGVWLKDGIPGIRGTAL